MHPSRTPNFFENRGLFWLFFCAKTKSKTKNKNVRYRKLNTRRQSFDHLDYAINNEILVNLDIIQVCLPDFLPDLLLMYGKIAGQDNLA